MSGKRPRQPTLFEDWAHPPRRGRVRRGFDATLHEWRRTDRLDPDAAAVVALCRVLADHLDDAMGDRDESRFVRAHVAGRYQSALAMLLDLTVAGDDLGADLAALLTGALDATHPGPSD